MPKTAAKTKTPKAKKAAGSRKPTEHNPGIIAEIGKTMQRERGASSAEILDVLTSKFPDRDPEKMIKTVRIQVGRLPAKLKKKVTKTRDEKRGLVYKMAA